METGIIVEGFKNCEHLNNCEHCEHFIRYISFIGDGDSSVYSSLMHALKKFPGGIQLRRQNVPIIP